MTTDDERVWAAIRGIVAEIQLRDRTPEYRAEFSRARRRRDGSLHRQRFWRLTRLIQVDPDTGQDVPPLDWSRLDGLAPSPPPSPLSSLLR